MSKRKIEDDFKHLLSKIKKLERKVNRKRRISSSSDEDAVVRPLPSFMSEEETDNSVLAALGSQDWLTAHDDGGLDDDNYQPETPLETDIDPAVQQNEQHTSLAANPADQSEPSTSATTGTEQTATLETDVLEILGEDPSTLNKYAPDVHIEIARRFQHIATEGLSKEKRKELTAKYLTPGNCLHIGAPGLNGEIKAALAETFVKRDKGIETKQAQMAGAISCLAEVLSQQLNSNEKNNDMLSKLMDMGRLLCDIQHGDSITRRNFVLFNLKKDMKEHLSNSKIDTLLFSESLPETLKSAKAISKSGTELKPGQGKAPKSFTPRPLNRRAPAPARRPPGPPPRSRAPAAPRAPPLPPPPAHYSRTSSQQPPAPAPRTWRR